MADKRVFAYISEQVSYPEQQGIANGKGFGITNMKDYGILYCTFTAVLQSFGVLNRNKRSYQADNISYHLKTDQRLLNKMKMNKFTGELGHPIAEEAGKDLSIQRLMEVPKERAAHIMRNLRMEGNLLKADVQTDPGFAFGVGIARDMIAANYVPAFSLRSFGEMLKGQRGLPVVNVKCLITYDLVEFPSHFEAEAEIKPTRFVESAKPVFKDDPITTQIIYMPDLAKYAVTQADQSLMCEAFNIGINDLTGISADGNHIIAEQGGDRYYIGTGQADREMKSIVSEFTRKMRY
jgi:hypothetical protein